MCKNLLIWTEDARVMIDVTGVGGAVKMTVFSSRSGLCERFEQPKYIILCCSNNTGENKVNKGMIWGEWNYPQRYRYVECR